MSWYPGKILGRITSGKTMYQKVKPIKPEDMWLVYVGFSIGYQLATLPAAIETLDMANRFMVENLAGSIQVLASYISNALYTALPGELYKELQDRVIYRLREASHLLKSGDRTNAIERIKEATNALEDIISEAVA